MERTVTYLPVPPFFAYGIFLTYCMCVRRPFALLFSHRARSVGDLHMWRVFELRDRADATGRGNEGTDEDISKGKRSAAAQKTLQMEKEKRTPPPLPGRLRAGKNHPRSHGPFQGREGGRGRAKPPSTTLGSEKKSLPMDRGKKGGEYGATMCYTLLPLVFLPPLFHSLILFFRWTRAE